MLRIPRRSPRARTTRNRSTPGKTSNIRRAELAAIGISIAFSLSACGTSQAGGASGKDGTTTTTSSTQGGHSTTTVGGNSTTTTFYSPGRIVLPKPDTPTTLPRETKAAPIPQDFAAGQQVIIYPGAFWPSQLYADDQMPITWTNMSGKPQKVIFDGINVTSPLIPPGAQFVWKSRGGGVIDYHAPSGFKAVLLLQIPTPPVSVP
jgi:hypothetical protein